MKRGRRAKAKQKGKGNVRKIDGCLRGTKREGKKETRAKQSQKKEKQRQREDNERVNGYKTRNRAARQMDGWMDGMNAKSLCRGLLRICFERRKIGWVCGQRPSCRSRRDEREGNENAGKGRRRRRRRRQSSKMNEQTQNPLQLFHRLAKFIQQARVSTMYRVARSMAPHEGGSGLLRVRRDE